MNCMCEPCGFDIRKVGYLTRKEDAAFEGTKCLWHEEIVGKKGVIYLSDVDEHGPLFMCDVAENGKTWLASHGWKDQSGFCVQAEFRLDDLDYFAEMIGATKR